MRITILVLLYIFSLSALGDTPAPVYNFNNSLVNSSGNVTLVNDNATPGNSKYYGTNGGGTLGFFNLPTSAVWGSITGNLSDQTDLVSALAAKMDYVTPGTVGYVLTSNGSSWISSAPPNSAIWGSITGTLSNQTDLQTALNGKEPTITAGTSSQYWRGDKSFQTLNTLAVPELTNLYYTQSRFDIAFGGKSTTNLTEGSNLYYTQGRFDSSLSAKTTDDLTQGATNKYYSTSLFNTDFSSKTTSNLTEGSNLYYTQGRFDSAFTAKSTSNLSEGTNLYYTNGRVDSEFDIRLATKSTTNLAEGTNLYYTQGRFDTAFSAKSTTNLTEGSNLYYTQGRFDSAFSAKSTTNLTEGSNLYYTDARARASLSASTPLSYNNGTGAFSITQSNTSTDGYLSSVDWNTFNNKAPINSPAFTGVPTAPTAALGTSTTQLATTAFVLSQGFQGATGSMPNASSTTLVTTTSASTTFVNALTTPITVTASSAPILAKCVLDMTSATSASVATVRVTVNAVSGGSVTESLTTATTQHLTVPNQNLSAALGPGTYTVNCDFNRASGTGTVTVGQGSLTAVSLQGTESNGISQLTGLGLSAGPGSGLQSLSGILTMAGGGTNAGLVASNGAALYSTASALALLAPGTAGQLYRSGGAAAPTWTGETFPASTTINQILYSSAANVVSGLATANTGVLVTSSTGVPSLTSCSTANRLVRTNGTTVSCAQANLTTDVTGTLPFAQGGTGTTTFANQRIPFSNGSIFVTDPNFFYDTTNIRLAVGGNSSAKIGAVVSSGSDIGVQSYCQGTNNCVQIRNQAAYSLAMLHANDANTVGVLVGAERSRGTQAARTQSLNGDTGLNLVGSCYTGSASSTGFLAAIQYVQSEDCTSSANGGEIVFGTSLNGTTATVERLRIKNSGEVTLVNTHLKSTQTTAPTATVQANAGTGATCSLSNSTDTAGQVSITTGTVGISSGSYCVVNFNKSYGVAPICTLTPASSTLSTSVYVTSATGNMTVNFAVAGGISATYLLNYNCIETQ